MQREAGGVGKRGAAVADSNRPAFEPESVCVPDEPQHRAGKITEADFGDAFHPRRNAAVDAESTRGPDRLAEWSRQIEREADQIAGEVQLHRYSVLRGGDVERRVPRRIAANACEETSVAGHRHIETACLAQERDEQPSRQPAVDREAGRVRCFGRSTDSHAYRLVEPDRGDVVGFDRGVAKRDCTVDRRQSSTQPVDVESIVIERHSAVDGDRPIVPAQGNRELEVDRAVAVNRDVVEHRPEPCAQGTLGEESHRVRGRALDASVEPCRRCLGVHVLDGHIGLPDGRRQDASRLDPDTEPPAVEPKHGRQIGDFGPAGGVAEQWHDEPSGRFEPSRTAAERCL